VQFRSDIQGLRAVAIVLVIGFHSGIPGMNGGFLGVDVFFAISGYLITSLLISEFKRTGTISVINFYSRRARRLLPASILMTLLTIGATFFIYSPGEIILFAKTAFYSTLFASNIWFISQASDYFAANVTSNPLLHTWSLAVEEQFYFCWPFLILVCLSIHPKWKFLTAAVLTVTLASVLACMVWPNATALFYSSPTRAWEFGIGALASLMPENCERWIRKSCPVLAWVGLTALLSPVFSFGGVPSFQVGTSAIAVIGTVLVLISERVSSKWGVSILFNNPAVQGIGAISYSWYLWHWPFLVFLLANYPEVPLFGRLCGAIAALIFATGTYFTVESPVRTLPSLKRRPIMSMSISLGLILGAAVIIIGLERIATKANKAPALVAITEAMLHDNGVSSDCIFPAAHVNTCIYGRSNASTTIVLFGDSHAWHWFGPINDIAVRNGWRLLTFMKASCPTAQIATDLDCMEWRKAALDEILKIHPSVLITSNSAAYGLAQPKVWETALRQTLSMLNSDNIPTLLILDNPQLSYDDIPHCLMRAIYQRKPTKSSCGEPRDTIATLSLGPFEKAAAEGLPFVRTLDLTDVFCDEFYCPATKNGIVVYMDGNHVAHDFAKSLGFLLEPHLVSLVESAVAVRPHQRGVEQ
jgi:peptidoglycan/LPS O-acetylase OafA/YrhL